MKADKLLIFAVVILFIIIILSLQKKKKQESSWWLFDKPTPPQPSPSMAGCTSCWVSSVEDGMPYCRWYDAYGRNTQTYEGRGCTGVQANIGFGKKKKKSWWELLFKI